MKTEYIINGSFELDEEQEELLDAIKADIKAYMARISYAYDIPICVDIVAE